MMKKQKRFLSLALALVLCLGLVPMAARAAASIEIGQYVQMGTYYGEPILWRCVDIDENGPLMLSDKILCLKPFDAETSANSATGSHSRRGGSMESNYWADSNLRSWLNSSASAGNVEWLCGNPPDNDHVWGGYNDYADEAGFLTNFSQSELNAVKTVTQKSLLSSIDRELATSGTENHYCSEYDDDGISLDISGVVTNYDDAYAEQVTDRMFLLDVKQINAVYNNGSILGYDYYIGEPTAACVANSEYTRSGLSAGNKWSSWLRSPLVESDEPGVRIVNSAYVSADIAGDGYIGVRPAFYLDLSSASFASGSGTASDPYTVEGSGSSAAVAYQSTQSVLVDGTAVEFQCYALKDSNGNLTNYIKLRDLADILNGSSAQFNVGWDGNVTITTKTAYTSNGSEGNTPFSGDRAYSEAASATKVNGQTAQLNAFVLNDDAGGGYTYYQLRDLGQTIGFNVGWSADKGIFVETDKPYDPAD